MRELAPLAAGFEAAGYALYMVGGVVRDLFAGTWSDVDADLDLTTDAGPQQIVAIVRPLADSVWTIGEQFGTIGLLQGHRTIEITAHRADVYRTSSRKPEVRFGTSLHDDLARRDFTINAMAIDLNDGSRHDPHDGLADLNAKVLRTPQAARLSFSDDPLRMVRAARFVARFGLQADPELFDAAAAMSDRLGIVSVERVQVELERLLDLPDPSTGFEFLDATGLLDEMIPSLPRDARIRSALKRIVSEPNSRDVRRAGLFRLAQPTSADVMKRMRYPTAVAHRTLKIIDGANTMTRQLPMAELVRTMAALIGESMISDAIVAQRAWVAAGVSPIVPGAELGSREPSSIDAEFIDRLARTYERLCIDEDLSDLGSPLSGSEVMSHLGLAPGPRVGAAMAYLTRCRLSQGPIDVDTAYSLLTRWIHEVDEAGARSDG